MRPYVGITSKGRMYAGVSLLGGGSRRRGRGIIASALSAGIAESKRARREHDAMARRAAGYSDAERNTRAAANMSSANVDRRINRMMAAYDARPAYNPAADAAAADPRIAAYERSVRN